MRRFRRWQLAGVALLVVGCIMPLGRPPVTGASPGATGNSAGGGTAPAAQARRLAPIVGRVVDADGKPVAGASITVFRAGASPVEGDPVAPLISEGAGDLISEGAGDLISDGGAAFRILAWRLFAVAEIRTDASGSFALRPAATGSYNLEAVLSEAAKAWVGEVRFEGKRVDVGELSLARPGDISGWIKAGAQGDLSATKVFIPGSNHVVSALPDGTFLLPGIPEGTFSVQASHPGLGEGHSSPVRVWTGQKSSAGEILMTPRQTPSPTPAPTATPGATPTPAPAPEPTPGTSPDPSPAASATPEATPTPEATAAPKPTPSPSPTPTATPTLAPTPAPERMSVAVFAGTGGEFNSPADVAGDGTGKVLVSDKHRIWEIDAGGSLTLLAGATGADWRDGPASDARFNSPMGIALAGGGSLLVADSANNRIRELQGRQVSTFAGSGQAQSADGLRTDAGFNGPYGIAFEDPNILVADKGGGSIRRIDANGKVDTLAKLEFAPWDVAVKGGKVYVSDPAGGIVYLMTLAGGKTPLAGGLDQPQNLAVGPSGDVYVSEAGGGRIRKVTAAGVVTALDLTYEATTVDRLTTPAGLEWVSDSLYVADSKLNRVFRMRPQ